MANEELNLGAQTQYELWIQTHGAWGRYTAPFATQPAAQAFLTALRVAKPWRMQTDFEIVRPDIQRSRCAA